MFRTRGFIFRKTVVYTVMVRYSVSYMHRVKQSGTKKSVFGTEHVNTYNTVTLLTTVFLKMNPRFRNM